MGLVFALSAWAQQKPFARDQVQGLVRDGLGDESGAKLIERRGIDFAPAGPFSMGMRAGAAVSVRIPRAGAQCERVATVSALVTVVFSFDDEPTVNSKDELTAATSGSRNLRRRSNCNLRASRFPPCATRSPSVSVVNGSPTARGLSAVFVARASPHFAQGKLCPWHGHDAHATLRTLAAHRP